MDAETIASLIGVCVAVLVIVTLAGYELRAYRREHGEGLIHHWLAGHRVLDRMKHRH